MKYLCLIYQDEARLNALTKQEYESLVAETLAFRDEMQASCRFLGAESLECVQMAMSVRARGASLVITDGPFVETKEQIGGYFLIEARDLNDAIRIASRIPPARLGGVEVRPIRDPLARLDKQRY